MAHTINDYLELITSQYQNSPKYKKWVERLLAPYIDTQKLASTLYTYFDIDKAVGKQLDMLGEVIGVKRLLPFQPEGSGTGTPNPIFNKSAFTVIGNPTITDDGVASGFSGSNYINIPVQLSALKDKSWSITAEWINKGVILDKDNTNAFFNLSNYIAWGSINFETRLKRITSCIRTVDEKEKLIASRVLSFTPDYIIGTLSFDIKTGTYTCSADWGEGEQVLNTYTPTSENKQLYLISQTPTAYIRTGSGSDNTYNKNAIDLKSISITVDGEEVFSGSKLNPLLDDENYRFLLKAQILRNVWNGTNQHIYEIWNELHSDIAIAIKDNQDMTVTALFIGDLNKLQQEMIKYGMIVPKAQGVKMFYAFSLPPLFSYDQDTEYFKGYDEGNWAESII